MRIAGLDYCCASPCPAILLLRPWGFFGVFLVSMMGSMPSHKDNRPFSERMAPGRNLGAMPGVARVLFDQSSRITQDARLLVVNIRCAIWSLFIS